eukprot:TRINITY_DN11152_c0_g1_i1.p1 TRINITY_DN11152_c0_g1~~TRINITY_DN11152_c0_g1_i1.p1  ORF type:complete len:472 (+),score=148.07 TRINITY_DN11152_c0_g1_i1:172-1587(+)
MLNLWVNIGAEEHAVEVSPSATVDEVKRAVRRRLSASAGTETFGIVFEDKLLEDGTEWIGGLGFDNGDRIRVTLRPEHKAMLMLAEMGIPPDEGALEVAIAEGRTDVMRMILTSKAVKGGHHLVSAVRARDRELMVQLIEVGVDLNARDREGFTPLIEAASCGAADLVEELLVKGAEVDLAADTGCTALMTAALFPCLEAVQALIGQGADPNICAGDGSTAVLHATLGGQTDILEALFNAGADPNLADDTGFTALMDASISGRLDIVNLLLRHGADTNLQANDRCDCITALVAASRCGRLEICRRLLAHNANPNAFDINRYTPLSYAAKRGDTALAVQLINAGADADGAPPPGQQCEAVRPPLLWAVRTANAKLVSILLEGGADPNYSPLGFTALHAAMFARDNAVLVVQALLDHGADPSVVDSSGVSALTYARARLHGDRMQILALLGAEPSQPEGDRAEDRACPCCELQ